jgi:predicted esterase
MLSVRFIALATALCCFGTAACSGDSGNDGKGSGGAAGSAGKDGSGGDAETGGSTAAGGSTTTGGSTGTGGGGPTTTPDGAPILPDAPAGCPEFHQGMAQVMSSGVMRSFMIYVDDTAAAAKDGPLVVYWYGTGGTPPQALQALTMDGVKRITDAGGVVVAPVHNSTGVFPWITDMDEETDFKLMDDIIGCAKQKVGIDPKRIHSAGFSAGALFTTHLSYSRSRYLASIAIYSGGGMGTFADANNKFAAMLVYGGPNDQLVVKFQDATKQFYDVLTAADHFAFECNHGGGHMIPANVGSSMVQFFFDHPFGTDPSPYKTALPSSFPSFCSLTPSATMLPP